MNAALIYLQNSLVLLAKQTLKNRSEVNLAPAVFKLPSSDSGLVILAQVNHFNYNAVNKV